MSKKNFAKLSYRDKSALFRQLVDDMERRDWSKAIAGAKRLLAADITEPDMFHAVLAAFIDGGDKKLAEKAALAYQKKFALHGQGHFYLGRAKHLNGDWEKAEEHFLAALTDDKLTDWYRGAVYSILGTLCREEGRSEEAAEYYLKSCELKSLNTGKAAEYSNYLFNLHYLNKSQSFMFEAARHYGEMFANVTRYEHAERRRAKIRLGYISPDLRFHVVAFFSYAFLHDYDKQRFEVYCYTNCVEDNASRNFQTMVDAWRNVRGLSPAQTAEIIYRDEIDILVDLAGHTAWNFLPVLAYKPAPVQISGIGYFDTTGLPTVDYFLADNYTDPPEADPPNDVYFTEKLLRLPHSHFCFMWHDAPEAVCPAPCLTNGFITFGSFNAFAKITDRQLKLWAKILAQVPQSRLYLKAAIFNNPYGKQLALKRILGAGIPAERLVLAEHESKYLTAYHKIDIALDTYPYPGGGTTCDALFMGVPVITLVGERHNSRFGYSLLTNVGLAECCAFDEDEYVQKAVKLAEDVSALNELRLGLRTKMLNSPLMQAKAYMAEVEATYERIWGEWQEGQAKMGTPSFNDKVKDIAALYQAEKPRLALDRLTQMVQRGDFAEDEMWQVYNSISNCYYRLFNLNKQLDYLWLSINTTLGQPLRSQQTSFSDYLMLLHYSEKISDEFMRERHFSYDDLTATTVTLPVDPAKHRHKKLRIGYLADTFAENVSSYFTLQFFTEYDRDQFDIYCYATRPWTEGTLLPRLIGENVRKITPFPRAMRVADIARAIYDDEIDILFDLEVHNAGGKTVMVSSFKPAPVQIAGIGYMNTSGLHVMDYFLTDVYLDPPGKHDEDFSEKLLRLPHSHFCFNPLAAMRYNLPPYRPKDYIVFGSFNNFFKITDNMINAWAEILRQVPNSKLFLKNSMHRTNALSGIKNKALAAGIPADRLIIEDASGDYLLKYADVDIVLDTYPYTGGATTCDALYRGIPVINLRGTRHGTRFTYSLLKNIGLGELSAASYPEYVALAVSLAKDRELLVNLRREIKSRFKASPIMDYRGYMREVEAAYREIWADWQQKSES